MRVANRRFTLITVIVVAIIFVSIYIVANEPISKTLEQEEIQKFQLLSYNKYYIFEENLSNAENNALFLSSRSEINRVLSEYISGETSLQELRDFTVPRYEDGTAILERVKSAGRFSIDGHLIHSVGETKDIEQYIDRDSQELVTRYLPEETLVMVQSPIQSKNKEIVGFDIVFSDFTPAMIQLEEGGHKVSVIDDLMENKVVVADGKVTTYIENDTLGQTIAISMDESKVFDSVKDLKNYIYIRISLVLLIIFLIVQFFGIKYIKGFFRKQNALKEKAEESERNLRIILDVAGEGLWNWDLKEGLVEHNKRWSEIMGVDKDANFHKMDEFVGQVYLEDKERIKAEMAKAISGEGYLFSEYRIILNDGRQIWVRDKGALIRDGEGNPSRMIGSMADITKKRQIEKELFLEKEVLEATLLSVGDGVITTDMDGIITALNPAGSKIIGWDSEEAIGQPLNQVFKLKDEKNSVLMNNEDILHIDQESVNGQAKYATIKSASGHEYSIVYSVAPISLQNGESKGFVVGFKDISELIERQKKIEYLSLHDELTGLYNRRYFEDAMHRLDTERNLPFAIMVIDINNLKLTNDVFGHEMGDLVIRKTGEILRKIVRSDDVIARTGGDEFSILLPKTSNEEVEAIKQRINEESKNHKYESLTISMAIGYAVKTKAVEKIENIIRLADLNMYDNKQSNRDRVRKKLVFDFLKANKSRLDSEQEHNERVSILSAELYRELGKSNKEVEEFRKAVEMHDIGKIKVPEEILNKKEALNRDECKIMKRHPQVSYEIMKILDLHGPYRKAILHHHERIDGKGYPAGLKDQEIPFEAKIIAIADAYEAMTSNRPYKKGLTKEEAIEELKKGSGTQFDPYLVGVFIEKILPNFEE